MKKSQRKLLCNTDDMIKETCRSTVIVLHKNSSLISYFDWNAHKNVRKNIRIFAFLVLVYGQDVFKSFNSDSIDKRTDPVLSAVWQLALFWGIFVEKKHCVILFYQILTCPFIFSFDINSSLVLVWPPSNLAR